LLSLILYLLRKPLHAYRGGGSRCRRGLRWPGQLAVDRVFSAACRDALAHCHGDDQLSEGYLLTRAGRNSGRTRETDSLFTHSATPSRSKKLFMTARLCHHSLMAEDYDVLIVTHHSAETLSACLDAVFRLSPPPAEILVLDNASHDGTPGIARAYDGIRLECADFNTGFTGGMNTGLGLLKSPWVLSLNPDCAPASDFVETLFRSMADSGKADEIGSATGLLMRASGSSLDPGPIIDSAGMVVTPSGRHEDRYAGQIRDDLEIRRAWVFGGTGAATLYRRHALEDVAYEDGAVFAPSFFAYREDAELSWRLQWRGWRCLFENTATAAHRRALRPELGRGALPREINRYSVRNRFLMRIHCADIGWHIRCFPYWLLRDLLVLGACLSIEISSLPGLLDLAGLRADAFRRRRWVLSRRKITSRQMARWFRRPGGWIEEMDKQ